MEMNRSSGVQAGAGDDLSHKVYGMKKVLLVDDIDLFIQIEKEALDNLDKFDVLVAHSGEEALRVIGQEHPDLIYMDLYMNGMDGDECCRMIKEKYGKDVPVIMVTHGNSANDFERCWRSGCDEIIVKPINHPLFIATTNKHLNIEAGRETRRVAGLKIKHGPEMMTVLTDYAVNLSTGGLFLATANIQPVDTCFAVEFSLPGIVSPICCTARVAWVNDPGMVFKQELPAGMGIQFIDISLESINALREYLTPDRLIASW